MTANPVYYNEWDGFCADWLENLMAAGLIPAGDVDRRSIRDVQPADLKGYRQCHFFAGIAGWSIALNLAGWPDDRDVWTGSCPCQPFSAAGKRAGTADDRHLWPEFLRLIAARRPPVVFGEQVASKDGRLWLAGVRADLEALGHAVGAADLCAAGVGAAHIRQRLFWVADAHGERRPVEGVHVRPRGQEQAQVLEPGPRGLALSERDTRESRRFTGEPGKGARQASAGASAEPGRRSDLIPCLDGKTRRVEPGTFPLAHGIPARVGQLRAYGNAIVPQVAAEFIAAYLDCRP